MYATQPMRTSTSSPTMSLLRMESEMMRSRIVVHRLSEKKGRTGCTTSPGCQCTLVRINGAVEGEGSGAWRLPHRGTLTGKNTVVGDREYRYCC